MTQAVPLRITPGASGTVLTPEQKRFNTLLRQIEEARQALSDWQANVASYRQGYVRQLQPLQEELLAGRREWVFALDALLDQHRWSKADRATLREMVCDAAGELLEARGDDVELKAVFDRHAEVGFDAEQREVMLAMKGLTEAFTGLDLGDNEGIASEEDLFARMEQGMQEREAARRAARQAKARKKTAAQLRQEAEAQQATQSVRDIYRKLASALHPDRETDPGRREEKTLLMQKVNQAYEANDLLAMLELQLRIEQIDADHVAGLGAERLKQYNKVLADQLAALRVEVADMEFGFRMEFGIALGLSLNPRKLDDLLRQAARQWRAEREEQKRELRMLGDVAATKRWLKRVRAQRREEDLEFSPF